MLWERSLSEIMKDYPASAHPVCGPLVRGGPALLAQELGSVSFADGVVDAYHLGFLV